MKNRYTITVLLCTIYFSSFSQNYPMETVGNPTSACTIDTYTGWTNSGVLNFSGDAQVQNQNPSNNLGASGGGNVYFNSIIGTNLQVSGFNPSNAPASMDISFSMYGYNVSNLSELVLEYSTNGGTTYIALPYKRLFRNYIAPTPWDVMVSDPLPASVGFSNLKLRFRQTSNTQQFRVDDIQANFYSILPIKLISFNAAKIKSEIQLNWIANSTNDNEQFSLERSMDARHFTEVNAQKVKGIGEFTYTYTETSASEKTFYRLKLTDANGRSTYSQVIFVQPVTKSDFFQAVYPNPAKESVNAQLYSKTQQNGTIIITDISGKALVNKRLVLLQGINNYSINTSRLNGGLYIMKVIANGMVETRSIVIQ